jgi:phage terminase large subunit
VAARKAVSPGIQAVASRMKGDGAFPRILFLRDSLVERDPALVDAKKPTCTEEEVESYVWNLASGRKKGEEPVKEHDHGMDATRYMVMHLDDSVGQAHELDGDVIEALAGWTGR